MKCADAPISTALTPMWTQRSPLFIACRGQHWQDLRGQCAGGAEEDVFEGMLRSEPHAHATGVAHDGGADLEEPDSLTEINPWLCRG